MSIENIDSTDPYSESQSNRFCNQQTIPPLIPNSPPPHLEAFEDGKLDDKFNSDSITEFNKNNRNLSDSNGSADTCNVSLPNTRSISLINDSNVSAKIESDKISVNENENVESVEKIVLESNVLEVFDDDWKTFGTNEHVKFENNIEPSDEKISSVTADFDPFNSQSNEDTFGWADFGQTAPTIDSQQDNCFNFPETEGKLEKSSQAAYSCF
jgi:hypothetical protein